MFIGTLKIELFIPKSRSLKDKRQVLSGLKQRVRDNFNVAIAEDGIDKWQKAILFVAGINGKRPHLEKTFSSIENMLYHYRHIDVINIEQELF